MDPEQTHQLDRLVRPRSVVIVGASGDPTRTAGRPALYLKKHGFTGTTYLVNPRYDELHGLPCFPSVSALPQTPDVGLILVGPNHVTSSVRELAERGAGAAIVLAGGYAEIGGQGLERERELKDAAGGMRLLGPNTIGLVNAVDHVALSASVALEIDQILPGRVGLVSQSGGILGSILSRAAAKGVGFSKLVATGNEADLEVLDIVEYLLDDPATGVIALYLEGLRNPGRFRELSQRAIEVGKPILAYKVGRSEPGARSATSHTGALAGSDRAYDAFFDQFGAIRLQNFADLIDVPSALGLAQPLLGDRVAIVTSTGGGGVLVADACGVIGFETPPPDAETAANIGASLVGEGAVPNRNPIDVTLAGLKPEIFRNVIAALLQSETYDAVIVIIGSSALADPDLAAVPIVESARTSAKPLLVYVSPSAPHIVQKLNQQDVPAFDTPEACAAALAAMRSSSRRRQRPAPGATLVPDSETDLPSGPLNELEALLLFQRYGIPSLTANEAQSPDEAVGLVRALRGSAVLKILSRDISHKSEAGGVRVNVSIEDAADVYQELLEAAHIAHPTATLEGVLVQEIVTNGVEMILGCIRDAQLGPIILLGAGGVATELYDDTAIRFPPLNAEDARWMIDSLKSAPLLRGFRGQPAADEDALVEAILAFSAMVMDLGDRLLEAEINPLFVRPLGRGVVAADGVARFQ